ncbi:hypothetical protein [Streptomyces lanatus]|uniref:Gram-positive cocci surface proteins LPxTG domain-containing protein n=1 Tax=Streptomyces lanatus TaxID=66900 RepID=A0ABV1Y111_9ACTN|nr:hypothetical protein [Streptomyces lanatus]
MRLHSPASVCLAAAALLAAAPPVRAEPPASLPGCATGDGAFPLTTRLHGGPASYAAGGGFGTWYLDLTNRTTRTCTDIHPVVVLVDGKRALRPSQPRLEFYDRRDAEPRSVRFETTDRDELVGAFDGFPGFTVGPRKTITVKVRLAVTSDAVPNEVTANAAVVQRHEGDGDWVGQSNDYRFRIEAEPSGTAAPTDPADREASAHPADPDASPTPGSDPARGELTLADELARTGLTSPPAVTFAATLALLLTGAALLVARKRR